MSRFGHQHTRLSVRTYEAPKYYLNVAPGLVSVTRRLSAVREHFGHNDGVETESDVPKRGRVKEWSVKSRNRMTQTLESLDYEPMFESGNPAAMVTLTLPGDGWEQLVPDVPKFKAMVASFRHAFRYAWGYELRGVWKMEFQKRGAPHLHILMVPPTGVSRGRGATAGKKFSPWLSLRWAQIVGADGRMRRDHELAGTRVDYREVGRYSDPRRIGSYFAKHGSFSAKDYQNDMPPHWQRAISEGRSGGGNFWGYWGLDKAIATTELTTRESENDSRNAHYVNSAESYSKPPRDAVVVMRHLRKLARSRSYIRKVEVERWSVDLSTGVVKVRARKVNRRIAYLAGRSTGFLAVNDGPATANDIARILHGVEGPGLERRADRFELAA